MAGSFAQCHPFGPQQSQGLNLGPGLQTFPSKLFIPVSVGGFITPGSRGATGASQGNGCCVNVWSGRTGANHWC